METPEDALEALKRELEELETRQEDIEQIIQEKKNQINLFDHVHIQKKPYFEVTFDESVILYSDRQSMADEIRERVWLHYFEQISVFYIRIEKKKKE